MICAVHASRSSRRYAVGGLVVTGVMMLGLASSMCYLCIPGEYSPCTDSLVWRSRIRPDFRNDSERSIGGNRAQIQTGLCDQWQCDWLGSCDFSHCGFRRGLARHGLAFYRWLLCHAIAGSNQHTVADSRPQRHSRPCAICYEHYHRCGKLDLGGHPPVYWVRLLGIRNVFIFAGVVCVLAGILALRFGQAKRSEGDGEKGEDGSRNPLHLVSPVSLPRLPFTAPHRTGRISIAL